MGRIWKNKISFVDTKLKVEECLKMPIEGKKNWIYLIKVFMIVYFQFK